MSNRIQSPHFSKTLSQLLRVKNLKSVSNVAPFIFPSIEVPQWEAIMAVSTVALSSGGDQDVTILEVPENTEYILTDLFIMTSGGDGNMDYVKLDEPSSVEQQKKYIRDRIIDALTGKPQHTYNISVKFEATANQTQYVIVDKYMWLPPLSRIVVRYDYVSSYDTISSYFALIRRRW